MTNETLKEALNGLYQLIARHRRSIKWILGLAVSAIVLALYGAGSFERFEMLMLDYRFSLRQYAQKDAEVVFIDMAEDSIDAIGRWPWPRKWHAALLDALAGYGTRAIAFDVIFSEPQDRTDDDAFASAISRAGNVYLPLLYDLDPKTIATAYEGAGVLSRLAPIRNFDKRLAGTGHINAFPDRDGIMRRAPAVISFRDDRTYQFGMQIAFDVLGARGDDVIFSPGSHSITLKLHGNRFIRIPLDRNNQYIINWQGRWGRDYKHYSFIDVIRSHAAVRAGREPIIDLSVFKDKICVIGLTATGLIDIKPIPIENAYPAVGVNATIIDNILRNDFIYALPEWADLLIIFAVVFYVTVLLCRLRLLSGMLLTLLSCFVYAAVSIVLFLAWKVSVVTFYPVFGIALSYTLTSAYAQVMQSAERARLFHQATRDGLTGLYNIRHFNLLYEAEFKNVASSKDRKLSLIMGDIDNFKSINDNHGHPAGDVILHDTARSIESKCRQTDIVARYGGEEFIVMLIGASAKEASAVAEKIRSTVEAKRFRFRDAIVSPTLSLGVAGYSEEKSREELVTHADAALYYSKKTGKNRVTIYAPGIENDPVFRQGHSHEHK